MLSTLLVFLALNGVLSEVHHFQGHSRQLSRAAARAKYEQREKFDREMIQKHYGPLSNKKTSRKAATGLIKTRELSAFVTATDLAIGTPKQNFVVEVDFFWASDLSVIGTNTYIYNASGKIPTKNIYNASLSTTSKDMYNICYCYNEVQDLVKFGSFPETNISFESMSWLWGYLKKEPVDGVLGLSPNNSSDLLYGVRLVDQIVKQLDQPLVSYWGNRTAGRNGTTQISLGAIDSSKCQSDFSFGKRLEHSTLGVNGSLSKIIGNNGSAVDTNVTSLELHFRDHFTGLRISEDVYYLLINASGANVSRDFASYGIAFVDCNTTLEVTLKVGDQNASLPLTLTADDILQYSAPTKKCYLDVENEGSYKTDFIFFGRNFANKHCLHYNIQKDLVSISTSVKQ